MTGKPSISQADYRGLVAKGIPPDLISKGLKAGIHPSQMTDANTLAEILKRQSAQPYLPPTAPGMPQQTPLEFLPEMGELFSNQLDDLRKITQAYIRIRYGELPEINEELDALEKSWQNVQEEGRRLKRSGVGKLRTAKLEKVERSGV